MMVRVSVAGAALLLAGCAGDPGLGTTVRANVEAMTVPPRPRDDTLEGGNGARGVDATRRYLTGRVRQPPAIDSASAFRAGTPAADAPAPTPAPAAAPPR